MCPESKSTPSTDSWVRSSIDYLDSVFDTNRATLNLLSSRTTNSNDVLDSEDRSDWDVELTEHRRDALSVGDSVRFSKHLTDDDVRVFAKVSGDTNRLHLDNEYAAETRFGGRIAHGTLVSGLISAALARLPGLVIYLSQEEEFQNPVKIGERVTAECQIIENLDEYRYRLRTTVTNENGAPAIDGEATILLDEA